MARQRSFEIISLSEFVTIGELARLTNIRYSTLKYYTEEGILPFEQEDKNLTRRYRREESIKRLETISMMKSQGKKISEIKVLLN